VYGGPLGVQDCTISNRVDMTAMENVTGARVDGGSTQYVHNAISMLRQHFSTKPVIDDRLIRDIFHIFSAEGLIKTSGIR
jgi:hypothetical protein